MSDDGELETKGDDGELETKESKPTDEEIYEKISAEEEGGEDLLEISDDDSDDEQTGGAIDKNVKVSTINNEEDISKLNIND